jgi:hypothetical protein
VLRILFFIIFIIIFQAPNIVAQDEELIIVKDSITFNDIYLAAIKPSKAAFYSAILPGLGQAYNKSYWKVPVVYGFLGGSAYYYIYNNDKYQEYRTAFKLHKLGEGESSQYPNLTLDVLQQAQKYHKKNRDLSLLLGVGFYVLQIVEASVDAHLEFHNTDKNLGFSPILFHEPIHGKTVLASSITYTF